MLQIPLDMGLGPVPSLDNFLTHGPDPLLDHLRLWTRSSARSALPTYLWGGPASGKTHLLRAVADALAEQGAKVGWLTATSQEDTAFDPAWAALLMDDVHAYGSALQHTAFKWFIEAQTHQRWVLATGALPVADLALRDDLRTRLGWGHVFALHALSEPEVRAVLRQQADARGIFLKDEVMDFVLKRFSRDLGSLTQLVDLLDKHALATQRPITVPLVKHMLDSM